MRGRKRELTIEYFAAFLVDLGILATDAGEGAEDSDVDLGCNEFSVRVVVGEVFLLVLFVGEGVVGAVLVLDCDGECVRKSLLRIERIRARLESSSVCFFVA